MTQIPHSNEEIEQKLDILKELTLDKIEPLLDLFGVQYKVFGNRIMAKCPIHNGSNPNAFCLYSNSGIWQCFTRHCEKTKGKTLIGLIRALLLRQLNKKYLNNTELIKFLVDFNKADLSNLKIDENYRDKKDFISEFGFRKEEKKGKIDRRYIRSKLVIPADYYIKRGYSPEVLNEFDIGVCLNEKMPLYNRVIVPIYDNEERMLGCTARSTNGTMPKWTEGGKFDKTKILYNYWKAQKYIREKDSVILVESPGNLWRLWEAGFKNCLALLGSNLYRDQFNLINKIGVSHIITLLDNDEAGKIGSADIVKMAEKLYKITEVNLPTEFNDVGDISPDKINDILSFIK